MLGHAEVVIARIDWPPHEIGHPTWGLERGELPDEMAPIRRWGKKRAGRELDGRTWDEYPKGPEQS